MIYNRYTGSFFLLGSTLPEDLCFVFDSQWSETLQQQNKGSRMRSAFLSLYIIGTLSKTTELQQHVRITDSHHHRHHFTWDRWKCLRHFTLSAPDWLRQGVGRGSHTLHPTNLCLTQFNNNENKEMVVSIQTDWNLSLLVDNKANIF